MTIALWVSFAERPLGLEAHLLASGFRENIDPPSFVYEAKFEYAYRYYHRGLSAQEVWMTYNVEADTDDREVWSVFAPGRRCASAGALLTDERRNGYDELVLYLTAQTLRERFDALVFDSYEGDFLGG